MNRFAPVKGFVAAAFGLALMLLPFCTPARAQVAQTTTRQGADAQPQARAGNLMQRLNLTPEQRLRLREIRKQGEPEMRELTRRVRQARRALDEAVYADTADEALVEQRARELSAAQAALVHLRASTELKVRGVLTPEQLRAFRELRRQAQRRLLLQRRLRRGAGAQQQPGQNQTDADAPTDQPDTRPSTPPRARQRRP